MPQTDWGKLLPEKVADWINFDRDNVDWHYEGEESTSMASRQVEGVAYLWNLLSTHDVALLADEVGMGKTFQALGVAALLWKMKPDAKVLIMAPNRDICAHWERELNAFVHFHFREADHCIKNCVDGGLVPVVQKYWRLDDLAAAVESNTGHLYLTTIYSLSGLVPQEEKDDKIIEKARANAKKIRNRIRHALGDNGFDLVIIDEAHYFRNKNGKSQRVNAAEEFFGSGATRLARKSLLLTATPSHTHLNDIKNILSYFLEAERLDNKSPEILMQNYGLRRFRRMKGIDRYHTKREYRNEKAVSCDFRKRPESEMFFALYQKKLVTDLDFTRNNKRLLYGFLEGFESPGRRSGSSDNVINEDDDDVDEVSQKDFSKARDTMLLSRLSEQYFKSYGRSPDHPKYGQLVDICLPNDLFTAPRDLHEDKHLIFVRRIPSVRELTQRINEAYDEILAVKIYRALGLEDNDSVVKKWRATSWSREGYDELTQKIKLQTIDDEEEFDADEELSGFIEGDEKLGSNIADLFVVKKGENGRTDCSNVRLRFRKRESAFAMFLEPASDYINGGYEFFYESDQKGSHRADYVSAARDTRLRKHVKFTRTLESENRQYNQKRYRNEIQGAWSLLYPLLSLTQQTKITDWAQHRPDIAENFANYLKAGFLFASPVMVELYAWFTEYNRGDTVTDVQQKYTNFIRFISPKLKTSLLLSYFISALDTFDALCEKIIDHKIGEWEKEWRSLTSLQNPAWYASGASGNRQRLILGFNSPFYPNVLISTSVFQEGVNLHLQCRKVHHYGIAGSPGNNEQRVGRVDRLFGKVNELLKIDSRAELEINYPFLIGSVDEDQVASFIAKKFEVEDRMDNCTQSAFDKTVELTRENWREFLRKPYKDKGVYAKDPYEASFSHCLPDVEYAPFRTHGNLDAANHIASLFSEILDPNDDKLFAVEKNKHNPNALFLIDPVIEHKGQRRQQPVLVEQHFSAEFSALIKGTVYYASLTSPLASKENLDNGCTDYEDRIFLLADELEKQCPLIRVAINDSAQNSHFYLHARVDLPLFADSDCLTMLSKSELNTAFQQLKEFSDCFELGLFSGEQDLDVSQLRLSGHIKEMNPVNSQLRNTIAAESHSGNWEELSARCGDSEHLFSDISVADFNKRYIEPQKEIHHYSPLIQTLVINGQAPFINFQFSSADNIHVGIGYPSGDIQKKERILLERWFDYMASVR